METNYPYLHGWPQKYKSPRMWAYRIPGFPNNFDRVVVFHLKLITAADLLILNFATAHQWNKFKRTYSLKNWISKSCYFEPICYCIILLLFFIIVLFFIIKYYFIIITFSSTAVHDQAYSCPRDYRLSASWDQIKAPSKNPRTSRQCGIEGFKGEREAWASRQPM